MPETRHLLAQELHPLSIWTLHVPREAGKLLAKMPDLDFHIPLLTAGGTVMLFGSGTPIEHLHVPVAFGTVPGS